VFGYQKFVLLFADLCLTIHPNTPAHEITSTNNIYPNYSPRPQASATVQTFELIKEGHVALIDVKATLTPPQQQDEH
jgi:hypothetical protein